MSDARSLILASTSVYRRQLLGRLGIPFESASPQIDETALASESPRETALRLAKAKARGVLRAYPDALIIGSDQVASCEGRRLDKPGTHANAVAQLTWLSGRSADFDTAVCLLDARADRAAAQVVACRVNFRPLSAARIESYLRREQPYDCAGSAKAEGLGIALIASIETEDPTSLIGLPLIALTGLLEDFGLSPI
jgi:7-methyl-GTP pyrophosphatase